MSTIQHTGLVFSPSRFLSTSTDSRGVRRYRALYGGQPLCADKTTLAEAWAVLKPYWPPADKTVTLWEGDKSAFTEIPIPQEVTA